MSMEFANRKLLVVGGTSGMGLETARLVLQRGGSAVLLGKNPEKVTAAEQALAGIGKVKGVRVDITEPAQLQQFLSLLETEYRDVDLLVNAAGVFLPKAFLDHEQADFDRYHAINRAFFFISQKIAANLVAAGRPGAFVSIGSMWAKQAVEATPSSAYSMAKAGLHALTQHLAMELASKKIRVNAVSPAVVETPIFEGFIPKAEVHTALQSFNTFHPIG